MDNKGAEYLSADNFFKVFIKKYPYFKPTSKSGKFFGALFILSIIGSALFINWGSFLSGSANFEMKFGLPFPFFQLSMDNPEQTPIKWLGVLVDIPLFFILGYLLDVLANYLYIRVEEIQKKDKPEVYKVKN